MASAAAKKKADGESSDPPVSMVARIALIMRVFDEPGARFRLDDIATRTGLPRSTVHRILDQLLVTGWIQRRPDGYSLSAGASTARHSPSEHPELRSVAAPVLNRLHLDTGLVVHLGVLIGTDVLVLDRIAGRAATGASGNVGTASRVGGRVPAHATALGKAILAQLPGEEIDTLFRPGLPKRSPRTIDDLPTLHQELGRIRARRGLAYENQELVLGTSALGAAIRADGLLAAISVGGAVPLEKLERLGPLMLRAAAHVTQRLSGQDEDAEPVRPQSDGVLGRLLRTLPADGWV
ncbi:IclR family transcriptional regulator [Nocardioides sp. QY071]|uniref:IclR family transcriptional regulator n=1 Tax=Nocardioides sp. QY071 TaxID=3044187 RepID=UPI00249A8CD4|nr:IclR family transcriptional regulator [Nocardioides sp. QY071]WGY01314.1 IclR family transcriptional regulator [Nocardioides sp. QY071]